MPQVCYHRLVFVPNSVPLCIISTQGPGPATVQKHSQWWRILEWIAWFNKWSSKAKLLTTEPSASYEYKAVYNGNKWGNIAISHEPYGAHNQYILCTYWMSGRAGQKNIWVFIDRVHQCPFAFGASVTILSTPQSSFNSQFTLRITLKTPSSRRMDDSNIAKPSIEGSPLLRTWNYQVSIYISGDYKKTVKTKQERQLMTLNWVKKKKQNKNNERLPSRSRCSLRV